MRRPLSLALTQLIALAAALATTPASAAMTATVSVVHGIPKTPVNVFVNGKDLLPDFQPGTVAGPLSLPPGTYHVAVFPAADTAGTGTPVITATENLTAGENASLVAHLTSAGAPTLTAYANDTSPVPAGQARIVVRHDAAAPAVDVRVNGKAAFTGLTNPGQVSALLPAGSVTADVVLAGTSTVVIGPATLNLQAGTETIVYAIGSATDKTLGLVTQTITGLGGAPVAVPAGSGGLAAPAAPATAAWVWGLAAAGALLLCAGLFGTIRRTVRARG